MNTSTYCRIAIAALIATSFSLTAHAQGGKKGKDAAAPVPAPAGPVAPAAGAPKGDDKVDISDLENKYWAPKDTDFSVVQNRTYSKTGKVLIAPSWGTPINDPYSDGNYVGVVANYFWSERMGVQLTYLKADFHDNETTKDIRALSGTSGAMPNHGKNTGHYSLGWNIVPFYAKMSFWGSRIIYFDMAFTPHIGMTQYEQQIEGANKTQSELTYGLDVSQLFFFSRSFALRVDLKNMWHHEEVVGYRGADKAMKVQDKTTHDTLFLIGPTFYW